jgi:DedD protein
MEKKTKHRILGILVVIGLILISLPFLQSGNEGNVNAALVTAPPFPDQATQVNSVAAEVKSGPIQPSPIPIHDPSQPSPDEGVNQQPDDTIKVKPTNPVAAPTTPGVMPPNTKNVVPSNKDLAPAVKKQDLLLDPVNKVAPSTIDSSASPEGTDYIFKNSVQSTEPDDANPSDRKTKRFLKMRMTKATHPVISNDANGLFNLKSAVWVIQMGSFKNKEKALRLVNKLRLNGYHAFIQQIASDTQVFVGPESKPHAARALKHQIEAELHITGIVVSYKPLKL